ncbi:eukaryotic translation initiation factor 5B isoform X2 [Brassica napus]|uniref:eukaryotic translation initiation factor 5B isoform X2 n=1 Tax=Brassica napus TaxID=3708 RepID=UPI0006AAA47D|nr:eukaryotic translation initiation factor 5B isoform X2 [Brassica napus]
MDQSESAYRIRGATASYLRGKGVVLEEDIRSREYGFYTAMNDVMGCLKKKKEGKEEGVYAIASSFGYLFELVLHLTSPEVNIPVTGLGVGPVTPADIRKVTQLPQRRKHTVLAFQVQFQECNQELGEDKKDSESDVAAAVSPCLLSILPKCVLNKEDPIVVGVYVVEGFVKVGTPLCIPHRAFVNIGRVAWIQKDQRPVQLAREGEKVIIKIVAADPKTLQGMMLGIDFDEADVLVSRTSRVAVYQVEINR